ncbi:MAG: DUF4276 family protein [Bryobacteraceae bacterium]|nr:DUF4276 family protein [Bryobacteraceae bacterium]
MIRLNIVVEGQTEETFAEELLGDDLGSRGVIVAAHRITTSRGAGRVFRGGFVTYSHLRRDLDRWRRQEQAADVRFSTMVDLYKLPSDFPGFQESRLERDPIRRAELLESAFADDIGDRRFIPYIQVHEFEALLFSNVDAFSASFPGRVEKVAELSRAREGAHGPEYIDDGPETSPAKRIKAVFSDYEKVTAGVQIARRVGLDEMQRQCSHFGAWLETLRALTQTSA